MSCLPTLPSRFLLFLDGAEESDFTYVSRVFSRLLSARHFMDLVATDIAAGLILLRHVQKTQVHVYVYVYVYVRLESLITKSFTFFFFFLAYFQFRGGFAAIGNGWVFLVIIL